MSKNFKILIKLSLYELIFSLVISAFFVKTFLPYIMKAFAYVFFQNINTFIICVTDPSQINFRMVQSTHHTDMDMQAFQYH